MQVNKLRFVYDITLIISHSTKDGQKIITSEVHYLQNSCLEGEIYCPDSSTCIDIRTPCGDTCLSLEYPRQGFIDPTKVEFIVDQTAFTKKRLRSFDEN